MPRFLPFFFRSPSLPRSTLLPLPFPLFSSSSFFSYLLVPPRFSAARSFDNPAGWFPLSGSRSHPIGRTGTHNAHFLYARSPTPCDGRTAHRCGASLSDSWPMPSDKIRYLLIRLFTPGPAMPPTFPICRVRGPRRFCLRDRKLCVDHASLDFFCLLDLRRSPLPTTHFFFSLSMLIPLAQGGPGHSRTSQVKNAISRIFCVLWMGNYFYRLFEYLKNIGNVAYADYYRSS